MTGEMVPANSLTRPTTLAEAMTLAKVLADSDLVPKDFKGKPANCLVAMQMGAEIGLNPFQALQSIAVIGGKPSLYGDAGLGVVMASNLLESIQETDQDEVATCTLKRKGFPDTVTRQFSAADAARIQMYESDGKGGGSWKPLAGRATWRNHPKRMRQMRARWWAMRDLFPDVLKGLRGAEELEEIIDVTPTTPGLAVEAFAELEPHELVSAPVTPSTSAGEVVERRPEPADSGRAATVQGPVLVNGQERSAMAVEDPKVVFELNGITHMTAGVSKEQMLRLFALGPQVNKRLGKKGYDKELLKSEFGLTTRNDLTAEAADQYEVRLMEILGAT
jgi:hypothetical protein